MDCESYKRTAFELLQIHLTDALHYLWRLPEDFYGNILIFVENSGFRSVPVVKGDHLAMKAFGRPLIHGLTGFEEKFEGTVELVVDAGLLSRVNFLEENPSQSDKYQHAFLTWYPLWEAEETKRMQSQGLANRLHGEMYGCMSISEKLDRRIRRLREQPVEYSLVAWAFQKITGVTGYTGWVTVRHREGGIMSTTPPLPPSANRQRLAKALLPILPQQGRGESRFFLNRGLLNPK